MSLLENVLFGDFSNIIQYQNLSGLDDVATQQPFFPILFVRINMAFIGFYYYKSLRKGFKTIHSNVKPLFKLLPIIVLVGLGIILGIPFFITEKISIVPFISTIIASIVLPSAFLISNPNMFDYCKKKLVSFFI